MNDGLWWASAKRVWGNKGEFCWPHLRISRNYRVVQLDFTPEIEVFYILFARSLSIFSGTSLKRHIWYFNLRCELQLAALYKDDRVTEKRFFIKNVYYHFESETLEIKFGALRYKEATKHARILNQCSLLFFLFHIGMWTRFSTGTGELGMTPAALHLTLDSNCPNTVHCASRVCAPSLSMRENLCDEKQLMRSQNEAETKLLSQWSSFRPK